MTLCFHVDDDPALDCPGPQSLEHLADVGQRCQLNAALHLTWIMREPEKGKERKGSHCDEAEKVQCHGVALIS
jgi:hypothetical protein